MEKARKRAIASGEGRRGVSTPFGFVIPTCVARKSFHSDRSRSRHYRLSTTRGNRDRGEILSRANQFAKHVTESGDEIPTHAASARCYDRRREFYASALIKATVVFYSAPKFAQRRLFILSVCLRIQS